jgi:DnaJ-class molecular chaperone
MTDSEALEAARRIACERCQGAGWVRHRHSIRNAEGIYEDRSDYPDCPRCKGTGIEPPDAPEVDRG